MDISGLRYADIVIILQQKFQSAIRQIIYSVHVVTLVFDLAHARRIEKTLFILGGISMKRKLVETKPSSTAPQLKKEKSASLGTSNTVNFAPYLRIIHIDVSQGESTLFILGLEGNPTPLFTALIDCGEAQYVDPILVTLEDYDVTKLNVIVNTHYDADHIEGLTALMEKGKITVVKAFTRTDLNREVEDKRVKFRNCATKKNIKLGVLKNNLEFISDADLFTGKAQAQVESCNFSFTCITVNNASGFDENDNSAAFLVKFGEFRYFTAGDLTSEQEKSLYANLDELSAFKCGHHGSKHSTSTDLLKKTGVKVGFISAGKHSYCHPDKPVLARLHDEGVATYLTNCCYNRPQVN